MCCSSPNLKVLELLVHKSNKEMTMANWFESVTKTLADDKLSRRSAFRKAAGTVAGVALASLVPGSALANSDAGKCKTHGSCSTGGYTNCLKKNTNCFCFQSTEGKAVCGCNTYCASAPPCSNSKACGAGKFCLTNSGCGCSTGLCVQKCNKTCILKSDRAGRTAAHA